MSNHRTGEVRPKVFLSYSSHDAVLVARLDRDLQAAGLTVWRDEHEIAPGESLRTAIFRDGLTDSDHIVIYMTPRSVKSSWVQQEVDAASVLNAERGGAFLSLFVDSALTRDRLTPELRALRSPILTEETYEACVRAIISSSWRGMLARRTPLGTGYPAAIEQAIGEQLLLQHFFKSQVTFRIVVDEVDDDSAWFVTELSYSVTNRTDSPHHWHIGKRLRRPGSVCEVFFNGVRRDAEGLDNRDARGLRVPCLLEGGETGDVLVRVREEMRVPDSELYTSYYPATDLSVHVTFPESAIAFDVEQLYFMKVQPERGKGSLEVHLDRGILPYQGLRLNWRKG
jgi:TIR domain